MAKPFLLACRIASYGEFQERGWSHLPEIGVTNVEVPVPRSDEDEAALRKRLADHGLAASSLQCGIEIAQADAAERLRPQLETCKRFGTRYAFVSVKAGDTGVDVACDRLKQIGDVAAANDVTVVMETHPDLVTNGSVAAATMKAVAHPNVKVNFDTANVSYYNDGANATDELAKCLDDVAAVHIKDYGGGCESWDFPQLGTGIVDFPAVLKMLDDVGFDGPCAMELEGVKGVTFDEAGRLDYVAKSVAYLKSTGYFA